jgi:hypothetical protein
MSDRAYLLPGVGPFPHSDAEILENGANECGGWVEGILPVAERGRKWCEIIAHNVSERACESLTRYSHFRDVRTRRCEWCGGA